MATSSFVPHGTRRSGFRRRLAHWYDQNKRTLPWRGERDPYRILVSEIMLQQTRVAVVEERYKKFLQQFPNIHRLARAREQTVLAAWSGLGYYRRARSLHAAAEYIVQSRRFPQTALELMELPGVGRYTANAVASIAFGEPVPVVDGNVKRVLVRFLGRNLSNSQCWEIAAALLDRTRPGDFNQAMMELGALVCLPRGPQCSQCPVRAFCASPGAGISGRPSPRKKGVLSYALICRRDAVLLQQRSRSASLMPGMWELPEIAQETAKSVPLLRLRHSITNTDYSVLVYARDRPVPAKGQWIPLRSSSRLPLTGLTRKILQAVAHLDHSLRKASVGSTAVARRAGR